MKSLEDAIIFATKKHSGQIRKDGTPYIFHPIEVAKMISDAGLDEKTQIVAVLHDVLEDTKTFDEEVAEFGDDVLEAVKLLTKTEDKSEDKYINDILNNKMAKAVKNADRINNLWSLPFNGKYGEIRTLENYEFAKRYIKDSEQYFKGKFSKALDDSIESVKELCEKRYITEKIYPSYTPDEFNNIYSIDDIIKNTGIDFDDENIIFLTNEEDIYCTKKDGFVYYESFVFCNGNWLPIDIDYEFVVDNDLFRISKEEINDFLNKNMSSKQLNR